MSRGIIFKIPGIVKAGLSVLEFETNYGGLCNYVLRSRYGMLLPDKVFRMKCGR